MSKNKIAHLPPRWETAVLGDVVDEVTHGFPCGDHNQAGKGTPHLRPMNISDEGYISLDKVKYVEENEKETLKEGDILFNNTNSPKLLGKTAYISTNRDWYFSNHMTRIRVDQNAVSPKWIANYLHSLVYRGFYRQHCRNHVNQASINQTFLRENISIPLPPLSEQKRIVAKIEELFSKLESGNKEMETANTKLNQYKRTVLQNSVEGKLTKTWRMDHEEIEPTDQLLQRTEERRKKECGGKYGKLIKPTDIPDGIDLPENWAWASLSQIGEVSRGKSTHRPRDDPSLFDGDYPFIQTGEVRAANTILNDYDQTYNEKGLEQSRLWPEDTLCITIAANIGETAILGIDACFPDSVVGFLTNPEYCNVRYVELYFRTIQRDLERYAPATAQKNINLGTLSDLPVPLPPIKEQNQIVQQVHSTLSVLTNNMEIISNELVRSEKLRQSILKQAFRGELVPHNQYHEAEEISPAQTNSESKPKDEKQATLSEVITDVE